MALWEQHRWRSLHIRKLCYEKNPCLISPLPHRFNLINPLEVEPSSVFKMSLLSLLFSWLATRPALYASFSCGTPLRSDQHPGLGTTALPRRCGSPFCVRFVQATIPWRVTFTTPSFKKDGRSSSPASPTRCPRRRCRRLPSPPWKRTRNGLANIAPFLITAPWTSVRWEMLRVTRVRFYRKYLKSLLFIFFERWWEMRPRLKYLIRYDPSHRTGSFENIIKISKGSRTLKDESQRWCYAAVCKTATCRKESHLFGDTCTGNNLSRPTHIKLLTATYGK